MKPVLALTALLIAAPASAQTSYYKCTDDHGRPVFSERPCGADAEEVSVESAPHAGSVAPADTGAVTASRKIRERERRIDFLEDRIDRFERERETRLAQLEASQRLANNNLAGAQYLQSLASEMQSVNTEFRTKIDREQSKIDRYREEIGRLQAALHEADDFPTSLRQ